MSIKIKLQNKILFKTDWRWIQPPSFETIQIVWQQEIGACWDRDNVLKAVDLLSTIILLVLTILQYSDIKSVRKVNLKDAKRKMHKCFTKDPGTGPTNQALWFHTN